MVDLLSFFGGVVAGLVSGFVLYTVLEAHLADKTLSEKFERFERRLDEANGLLQRFIELKHEMGVVAENLGALKQEASRIATRLSSIASMISELEKHVENVDRIVSKKMRYAINIEVKPEEIG